VFQLHGVLRRGRNPKLMVRQLWQIYGGVLRPDVSAHSIQECVWPVKKLFVVRRPFVQKLPCILVARKLRGRCDGTHPRYHDDGQSDDRSRMKQMTHFLLTVGGISDSGVSYNDSNRTLQVPARLYHCTAWTYVPFRPRVHDWAGQVIIYFLWRHNNPDESVSRRYVHTHFVYFSFCGWNVSGQKMRDQLFVHGPRVLEAMNPALASRLC
jgi:hypothetical protein